MSYMDMDNKLINNIFQVHSYLVFRTLKKFQPLAQTFLTHCPYLLGFINCQFCQPGNNRTQPCLFVCLFVFYLVWFVCLFVCFLFGLVCLFVCLFIFYLFWFVCLSVFSYSNEN